jgi:hypothetical protein
MWIFEIQSGFFLCYRLVDKYMPQLRLMKLNRINRDEIYLSFGVVSIALT